MRMHPIPASDSAQPSRRQLLLLQHPSNNIGSLQEGRIKKNTLQVKIVQTQTTSQVQSLTMVLRTVPKGAV